METRKTQKISNDLMTQKKSISALYIYATSKPLQMKSHLNSLQSISLNPFRTSILD